LEEEMYSPLDTSSRSVKNVYEIINKEKINDLMNETRFGETFAPFSRIINREGKRYADFSREFQENLEKE
jgi:hypothetical protein